MPRGINKLMKTFISLNITGVGAPVTRGRRHLHVSFLSSLRKIN